MVEADSTGLTWVKSSVSQGGSTECVEMAAVPGQVLIRDSRDRGGRHLNCPASAWDELLTWLVASR